MEEEGVDKLFFELASESRLDILNELENKKLKMQEIARLTKMTTTETFRQLNRLSDSLLIEKQSSGSYAITSYGKLVLELSHSFEFANRNRRYLMTRDLSRIPSQFINRFGELSKAVISTDIVDMMNKSGQGLAEAEKYIWVITGQPSDSLGTIINERVSKGVSLRVIFPENLAHLFEHVPEIKNVSEKRSLPEIPGFMICTEKGAGINLLSIDGRPDYMLLYGRDSALARWAGDLFSYYWEKGKHF